MVVGRRGRRLAVVALFFFFPQSLTQHSRTHSVLVEKLAAPTKTVGGVLLPESATAGKVRSLVIEGRGRKKRTTTARGSGRKRAARMEIGFRLLSPHAAGGHPLPYNHPPHTAPRLENASILTHEQKNQKHAPPQQLAEGRVIATGSGRRSALSGDVVPLAVKEGDTVLLPEYGGQTIKLNNQE